MKRKLSKVLLINPPRVILKGRERKRADYPLGLGYVGAMLKMEGFKVEGLDVLVEGFNTDQDLENGRLRFGLTDDEIKSRIRASDPDVVGVSNLFSDGFPLAKHMCYLAKQVNPDIITLFGGNHPSAIPENVLRWKEIDYIIVGEGDYSTGMLLRAISNGRDLSRLPGIAYRDPEGNPVINPFIEPIQNLDILPIPDRSIFPVLRYSEICAPHGDEVKQTPYTCIITSRGCAARCIYCGGFNVHGRRFRPRSPENVLNEIEYLVRELGFNEIHFEDDNLTHDKTRAMKIFRGIIDRRLNITWTPTSGIVFYNMDREMLTAMRDSGCYTIWVPVESGDPVTLRRIKKPMPIKRIAGLIREIKELGMAAKGFFMYGFPGETIEQMENTFQFARELELDYSTFFMATPLPGTEMWEMALKENPELADPDFNFENLKFAKSNLAVGGMSFDEMERMRRKVWLKVNWNLDEDESPPPGM
ncbi:cobalamin-dependent protein [bacterium]|nr:cobalamin-dependent protein [candidate division CSSED10-310 bacterium]